MLAFPFVAPVKGFAKLLNYLIEGLSNILESALLVPVAKSWEENLTDLDVFYLWNWDKELNKYFEAVHKKDGGVSQPEFVNTWWEKKYGEAPVKGGKASEKFQAWILEMSNKAGEVQDAERKKNEEKYLKKEERDEKLERFRNGMDSFFDRIGNEFRSWKNLIKWTKRVMGLIITSLGLLATFFVVNFMGRGILWIVANWNWTIFFGVIIGLAVIAFLVFMVYVVGLLLKYLEAKGRKLWAINILYYLCLGIALPFKWIFYNFLWRIILVNLWYLIKKGAIGFWDGFLGFLGIFGEYFGASYTDYCPGIDWEEEK